MTALLAAGGGFPLALHIPHLVEQAGSIAGFAAIVGLAVLSALYFSQARDLRRLREWAGRAPERAAEMGPGVPTPVPGRVVAVPQRAPQAVQGPATPAAAAAAGAVAPGAAQAPQPAGANGSPAVEVKKGEGEPAKVGAEGGAEDKVAEGAEAGRVAEGAPKPGDAADGEPKEAADGDKGEAMDDGKPAPAKPGMPAPASAAAAAGAGVASAAGPAAPTAAPSGSPAGAGASAPAGSPPTTPAGSPPSPPAGAPSPPGSPPTTPAPGSAPGAPPQRPPGSVLPPRTGTLPPVRRLPSSNVGRPGAAPPGVVGSAPEPKRKRNPVYVVLAVAGVLILGAGAAIGVPKLVNGATKDDSPSSTTAATKKAAAKKKAATPVAKDKITVAVLNGTSIPGLAAQIGDRIDADGFTLGTVSNASQTSGQRANSVAMYADGHERDARVVARKLRIRNVQPVDSESQSIAGDASVVVIVGSDKTQ